MHFVFVVVVVVLSSSFFSYLSFQSNPLHSDPIRSTAIHANRWVRILDWGSWMLILRRETRAPLTTKTVLHFVRRPSPVVGSDRPSLLVTPSTSTTRCCEYRIVLIGGSRRRLLSLPSVVVVAVVIVGAANLWAVTSTGTALRLSTSWSRSILISCHKASSSLLARVSIFQHISTNSFFNVSDISWTAYTAEAIRRRGLILLWTEDENNTLRCCCCYILFFEL